MGERGREREGELDGDRYVKEDLECNATVLQGQAISSYGATVVWILTQPSNYLILQRRI